MIQAQFNFLKQALLAALLLTASTNLIAANPEQTKSTVVEPGAASAAVELAALLKPLKSFSAQFEQALTDDQGKLLQSTVGKLVMERPLRFHWETAQPFAQTVVSNGQTLWVYDQDLEQVVIQDVNQEQVAAPLALLSGELTKLQANYVIEVLAVKAKGVQRFALLPKPDQLAFKGKVAKDDSAQDSQAQQSNEFEQLQIEFVDGELTQLQLQDNFGQITELTFQKQQRNPTIAPKRFEFDPPQGVDQVDERASANVSQLQP